MVISNTNLLNELYKQSETRHIVDTCLYANDGCIYVHWAVLIAAGNRWLVDIGDPGECSHTMMFPDHSIIELQGLVRKLYCQALDVSTPFETVPSTPEPEPELFYTAPETPAHHPCIEDSPRQHRLQMLDVSIKLLNNKLVEALSIGDYKSYKENDDSLLLLLEEKGRLEGPPQILESSFVIDDPDVKDEIEDCKDDLEEEEEALCPDCGLKCKSKLALRKHKHDIHQVSLCVCSICGKYCESKRSLSNHMRQHNKKTCDVCSKEISVANFKRHHQQCVQNPPQPRRRLLCLLCDFQCSSQKQLDKHIRTHEGFKCGACAYHTYDERNFWKHKREVHNTKKFHCHFYSF